MGLLLWHVLLLASVCVSALRVAHEEGVLPAALCARLVHLAEAELAAPRADHDSVDGMPTEQVQIVHALRLRLSVSAALPAVLRREVLPRVAALLARASRGASGGARPFSGRHAAAAVDEEGWTTAVPQPAEAAEEDKDSSSPPSATESPVLAEAFVRRFTARPRDGCSGRAWLPAHVDAADLSVSIELSARTAYSGGLTLLPSTGPAEAGDEGGGGSGSSALYDVRGELGSACVHPGNRLHFVHVDAGTRFSLVLFYYASRAAMRRARGDPRGSDANIRAAPLRGTAGDGRTRSRERAAALAVATIEHARSTFPLPRVSRSSSASHVDTACGAAALAAQRGRCLSPALDAGLGTAVSSFMYRYILRESCSQFDSLPLTSLTISCATFKARTTSLPR
jgi:hypothetical protein